MLKSIGREYNSKGLCEVEKEWVFLMLHGEMGETSMDYLSARRGLGDLCNECIILSLD
jgi:hypothetical protein